MRTRHTDDGENAHFAHFFVEALHDVFFRQSAGFKELLHQFVLAFGHRFHQLFVSEFGGFSVFGGDFRYARFAVAIGRVEIRFHADQVNNAAKILVMAEGQMDRDCHASEAFVDTVQCALETGAVAVKLVDDDGAGECEFFSHRPHSFRLRLHA